MGVRLTWTDCDETGDYVVPNVLSPRDLVSRPDKMDELYYTVRILLHYRRTLIVGTISEAVLTSTHNLCFEAKIRKKNAYPC